MEGFAFLNSETAPLGITFGAGGTKLFIHEIDGNDFMEEYNLTTPYNLIDIDGEHDGDVLIMIVMMTVIHLH